MFSSTVFGEVYAYITGQGKPTLHGAISIRQKNYNPDDISMMDDLCQIAVNDDGIFGLTRSGRVLMNSSTSYIKNRGGYSLFVIKENGSLEKYDASRFSEIAPDLSPKPIASLCPGYSSYQRAELARIRGKEEKARKRKEEKEAAERKKRKEEALHTERREKGLRQHCGGELEKKLFGWKCKTCGQKKDY